MEPYTDIDRTLTPQHRQLKEAVHAFSRDVLRPAAARLDRLADPAEVIAPESELWSTLRAAYAGGFHTALIPAECGGMGLDGLGLHIALEELGWGSADFAAALCVAGFPFASVAGTGDAGLIDEIVRPFVANRDASTVGCWALTEPGHGSDHFMAGTPQFRDPAITGDLVAREDGDGYVLNGRKSAWISNGTIATHAIVYLGVEPRRGFAGGGVAYVPLDLPGVTREPPLDKLGQRALNQGGFAFAGVRIPRRYLIVGPDAYEGVLRQTLSLTNAAMGAIFTGVARAALEEALAWTQTRVQGGVPICRHQLVQKHLFDLFTKVQNCRHLSRAAFVLNAGAADPALEYSVAAKVYCTQAAYEVADTALQLFGGRGLSKGWLVEKLFRDARASLIEDGCNDVLTLVGAHELLRNAAAPAPAEAIRIHAAPQAEAELQPA